MGGGKYVCHVFAEYKVGAVVSLFAIMQWTD